jgi:hypothetical protein
MDCLRSFVIGINQNRTFNTAGTNVKTWGVVGNLHWVVKENIGQSIFDIQGFKTIRLFGIQMVGNVQTDVTVANGCIVEDYSFIFTINGQIPRVSGEVRVAPNFYNLIEATNNYQLSKFTNEIVFKDPIEAVTAINFIGFEAQGNNGETLNSINLDIDLQFVFYYKYDGE